MQKKSQANGSDKDSEASFNAQQNAYVAYGAERYYRSMIDGNAESWNIRDKHMADTLERLVTNGASHKENSAILNCEASASG